MGEDHKKIRRSRWAAIGAAVAVTLGAGGLFAAEAASDGGSVYQSIVPVRVLDTRDGTGGIDGPLGAKETVEFNFVDAGVPAEATSVTFNLTVVGGTAPSYLRVSPAGEESVTSAINWTTDDPIANQITVKLGADGDVASTTTTATSTSSSTCSATTSPAKAPSAPKAPPARRVLKARLVRPRTSMLSRLASPSWRTESKLG